MNRPLKVGTRGSPLALAQTGEVCRLLAAVDPSLGEPGAIETVIIATTGDREQTRPLAEIGGKGLFTKEIDEALLDGRIDLAVNSAKDVPTFLPASIVIAAAPRREDARDAFLSHRAATLQALDAGATVGTSSPRRAALVHALRPDLKVAPIRGNVETRLRKLAAGEVDATLLAVAGLNRLGLSRHITSLLDPDVMLPASGQGIIAITCRAADDEVRKFLVPLNVPAIAGCLAAERSVLAALDGSCRTPIGAFAEAQDGQLWIRALVAKLDGSAVERGECRGPLAAAEALGRALGEDLLARAGDGFLYHGSHPSGPP
ncbi:MAG: hydroxymethylbilane synthase [Proteobacteria bacterium]|nr:hydroxymethylbilane synthase [Pseudomonadota bacterium]